VYTRLGSCYVELEDYELAIESYDKAIRLTPDSGLDKAILYWERADIHIEFGEKLEALQDYKKSAEIYDRQSKVSGISNKEEKEQHVELLEIIEGLGSEVEKYT